MCVCACLVAGLELFIVTLSKQLGGGNGNVLKNECQERVRCNK